MSAIPVQVIDVRIGEFRQYMPPSEVEIIARQLLRAVDVARGQTSPAGDAPTISRIADVVCDYYNYSMDELRGRAKPERLAWARQVAMALSYRLVPLCSYERVGEFFNRDHGTVIHAEKKVANDVDCQTLDGRQKKTDVEEIKRRILG